MSFTLFYKRPIHSTLYILLSILFTDKLVRYILFKFHSYFNQHKVNVIEAFLMPFITLFGSLFVNIKACVLHTNNHAYLHMFSHKTSCRYIYDF